MEIAKHAHATVIVSSEWRNVGAVKLLIGASDNPDSVEDGGSLEAEILDAIDECPNNSGTPSPREKVLDLVEWLSELHYSHLSICITSRPEADIEAVFRPLATHSVSLHGENGQKEDIVNYIKWFINSDIKARKWRKEDKELVLEKLSERVDGM